MRRRLFISLLLPFVFVKPGLAANVTLRGYVTAVHSPISFEMDEYKVLDSTDEEYARIKSEGREYHPPTLKPGTLRIGLEVEVKGHYDRKSGEVRATSIKNVNDDSDPGESIEGMGLVEDKAWIQKTAQGWSGRVAAEGEMLVVTPDTIVSTKRSRTERQERQSLGIESDDSTFSPGDIDLDTFAHYVGVRQPDHSILAKRIEFRQDRAATESDWSYLEPKVVYENPKSEAGTLHIGEKIYDLFPSPEAADYLGKLGASLIPAHQKELPEKSPGKVRFRFFLANIDAFVIDTYPNGVVVVGVHVFDVLNNEGQFAFVLAHEMARVVEKQQWTLSQYHSKERMGVDAVGVAAIVGTGPGGPLVSYFIDKRIEHKFVDGLHRQADRVGVQYMLAAGYDPNEAVVSWKVLEKKHPQGPFWGESDVNFLHRTYLESELQLNYANHDFSSLKRDSSAFHVAVDAVKAARVRAKTKKR